MLDVCDQRVAHVADAALFHLRVLPGQMSEVGIDGDPDHFDVARLEFVQTVIESDDLGRTHEGEVQRVEEHDSVLARDVLFQIEGFVDLVVAHDGNSVEIGSLLAYEYGHVDLLNIEWLGFS